MTLSAEAMALSAEASPLTPHSASCDGSVALHTPPRRSLRQSFALDMSPQSAPIALADHALAERHGSGGVGGSGAGGSGSAGCGRGGNGGVEGRLSRRLSLGAHGRRSSSGLTSSAFPILHVLPVEDNALIGRWIARMIRSPMQRRWRHRARTRACARRATRLRRVRGSAVARSGTRCTCSRRPPPAASRASPSCRT